MPRRGENIRKRKDGRWEARFPFYDAASGKRKMRSLYGKSYTEVKLLLKETNFQIQNSQMNRNGQEQNPICSFQQAADEWLLTVKQTKKRSTYVKYKGIYEKYLSNQWKDISLNQINGRSAAERLKALYENNENLSVSLRQSIRTILNQIFEYGRKHYDISCQKVIVDIPKHPVLPIEVFTAFEQARLISLLYQNMDVNKLGIFICMSTGLRLGEICALQWADIDISRMTLKVNRTVQRIKAENAPTKTILLMGEPKSIFSKREIPLSDELVKLFERFYKEDGFVLNGKKPLEPRTYEYRFARMLAEAGIQKKNFHVLRHTFATNCIGSGTDVKSLSEILGHSDVKITLNRYVHPTLDTKRGHINCLASIYGQYRGQNPEDLL